ncbi:hypothetical protein P2318_26545 [Myxococcaceae bacterium GXIMD 01537]
MRLPLPALVLSTAFLGGCIVEAPGGASPAERRQAVVAQVPPLTLKTGANLGGQVELVGATVQPGRIVPGEAARITTYYKVLKPLEEDYLVFVHIEDADGRMERLNIDHKPAGGLYPTTAWKPGETVKDEFTLYLPAGVPARAINIWLGLWEPKNDARLPLTNPDAVRNDGRHRILLAQVPVAQ